MADLGFFCGENLPWSIEWRQIKMAGYAPDLCTPLAVVSRARKTLRVSTIAGINFKPNQPLK
jgi:RNase adaptor protein for sRNA GlmZ degradation